MPPLTASEAVSPAYERMKQICFRPFDLGRWAKLAIVVLAAGEVGSFNGFSFKRPLGAAAPIGDFPPMHLPGPLATVGVAAVITTLILLAVIFMLAGTYFWARFRF